MDRRQKFGAKIKYLREARGFSVEKVAAGTGLQVNTIARIEAGRFIPHFNVVDKIAEFYGMEINIS